MSNMFSQENFYNCHIRVNILNQPTVPKCGSTGKESACYSGDMGWIPGLGKSPGEGNGYPLQYSLLEISMDSYRPWGCKESDTTERLSQFQSIKQLIKKCLLNKHHRKQTNKQTKN